MPSLLRRTLLGVVLVVLWAGAAWSAAPAGTVVGISGQCFVEAEGKRTPLKLGAVVNVADTLDVPADAKLKLRMNDGSIVSVAAGSQLTIAAYTVGPDGKRHDVALSLGQGLIRAVVAPIDPPAPFEVKTAVGAAGVRSTDWFIEAQPGETVVAVLVGSVSLSGAATGAVVTVPARSGANVSAGQDPAPPRVWRQAEFNALIARTDLPQPAAPRRAPRPRQPTEEEPSSTPAPSPRPPGGYDPGPGGYEPPPGRYNPGLGGYEPPGYSPNPGGGYRTPPGGRYPGSETPTMPGRRY